MSAFQPPSAISRTDITGLVLAGGMGTRMGGQDKGLMPYLGEPLVLHVLRRLAPQVGGLMVSANRHLDAYTSLTRAFAAPVCCDALPSGVPDYPGPLGGMLTGLLRCTTPYLAVVPCDVPHLPLDLVARLAHPLVVERRAAALAVAAGRRQPTLCLLSKSLAGDLADYLSAGHRKLDGCLARWQACEVLFDDAQAFRNINTPEQLNA